jgi:capsular exopolysaccharide synthesis family protein
MRSRFLVEPNAPSSEPFRTLRLAVEARLGPRRSRGLIVASPRARDGRSTLAANYAVVAALVQKPVLLLDADMRNPTLHGLFGVQRTPGLVDALRDRLDLGEVVHQFPALGGLHLLTAGSPLPRPGDIAASPAMGALLERAHATYEAVVIDSPPVLMSADASGLASHAGTDVILVVNRAGKRRHVASALRRLALTEASVLGLVVNREGTLATDLAY